TGFAVAFLPLYLLGLMGATRRLDFLSPVYHPLLVVAAVGAGIIALAVATQALMLLTSILKRKDRLDTTGDYWNGRTLEWSTTSPAPFYNFAHIPHVHGRDAFWLMKEQGELTKPTSYNDIHLPKNSMIGLVIAEYARS